MKCRGRLEIRIGGEVDGGSVFELPAAAALEIVVGAVEDAGEFGGR